MIPTLFFFGHNIMAMLPTTSSTGICTATAFKHRNSNIHMTLQMSNSVDTLLLWRHNFTVCSTLLSKDKDHSNTVKLLFILHSNTSSQQHSVLSRAHNIITATLPSPKHQITATLLSKRHRITLLTSYCSPYIVTQIYSNITTPKTASQHRHSHSTKQLCNITVPRTSQEISAQQHCTD